MWDPNNRWENNMKMISQGEKNDDKNFNENLRNAIKKLDLKEAMSIFHENKFLRGE